MIKELKANILYLYFDHRYSVMVFWSIFLLATAGILAIALFSREVQMSVSTSMAIYIFCGITGFMITKETFPFLIKLGSTRNSYVLSVVLYAFLAACFMSAFSTFIIQLINVLNKVAGIDNFRLFTIVSHTNLEATWYNELWLNILICLLFLALGTLLGSLFYRFGLIGGFSAVVFYFFIAIIPSSRDALIELLFSFENQKIILNYFAFSLLALIPYILYWFILRKASTTPGVTR